MLEDIGEELPLELEADGWFRLVTDRAGVGSRYVYVLDDGTRVPDPASRFQPDDVHGPSEVVDPRAYAWRHPEWRGRPWHEAVVYELHVGAFSATGDYAGVEAELDRLADLGVTAIELMPLSDTPGRHNWGYDGVLPFAPESVHGRPDDLKRLIDAAHGRGLMVLLDVVHNHFGPDGNYLGSYAPDFFDPTEQTPWGPAINFQQRPVRDFVVQNVLYWLNEYRFDGLRFDAVHALIDKDDGHILDEIATAARQGVDPDRHVHLVLENELNEARRLVREADGRPRLHTAQWNDDVHHCLHVLASGDVEAYYGPYADDPAAKLLRALASGFVWQGEPFSYWDGEPRGEPSASLPPTAFVNFLQNHDQIGNRALGERLDALAAPEAVAALLAVVLLAPQVPMLFMGEEYAAPEPFLFFTDFDAELGEKVRDGRRAEFKGFAAFQDPAQRARIPDPNDAATFARTRLDPSRRQGSFHTGRAEHVRRLLRLRAEHVAPRLAHLRDNACVLARSDGCTLLLAWRLDDDSRLELRANLGARPARPAADGLGSEAHTLFATHAAAASGGVMPPWSVVWRLQAPA